MKVFNAFEKPELFSQLLPADIPNVGDVFKITTQNLFAVETERGYDFEIRYTSKDGIYHTISLYTIIAGACGKLKEKISQLHRLDSFVDYVLNKKLYIVEIGMTYPEIKTCPIKVDFI